MRTLPSTLCASAHSEGFLRFLQMLAVIGVMTGAAALLAVLITKTNDCSFAGLLWFRIDIFIGLRMEAWRTDGEKDQMFGA